MASNWRQSSIGLYSPPASERLENNKHGRLNSPLARFCTAARELMETSEALRDDISMGDPEACSASCATTGPAILIGELVARLAHRGERSKTGLTLVPTGR